MKEAATVSDLLSIWLLNQPSHQFPKGWELLTDSRFQTFWSWDFLTLLKITEVIS